MADYLTYPFRIMRITQNYNGTTSHYGHSHGNPRDYPVDEGGSDQGRDPIYAPCDVRITRIWGVGTSGVNTVFCESTAPVMLANGKTDYASFQITHPNDSDLRRLKVGQIIKKGSLICYEGTDGASANHIHLAVGRGKFVDATRGWVLNSKNKYVINTTGGALKPEEAFFVDPKFTVIKSSGRISFSNLPTGYAKWPAGNYKVISDLAPVRTGAGTSYPKKPFNMLTDNARAQIKKLNKNKKADGFVKGMVFTASRVMYVAADKHYWGQCPSGWVCLDKHCEVATK